MIYTVGRYNNWLLKINIEQTKVTAHWGSLEIEIPHADYLADYMETHKQEVNHYLVIEVVPPMISLTANSLIKQIFQTLLGNKTVNPFLFQYLYEVLVEHLFIYIKTNHTDITATLEQIRKYIR
jgi:hypothetical protein